MSAIVEADETYRLELQKALCTLDRPARKRGGVARRRSSIANMIVCPSPLTAAGRRSTFTPASARSRPRLATCLLPLLAPDVRLISDAAAAYRRFCAHAGITDGAVDIRAGIRARGTIHVQSVSAWHSRFKSWLVRFRGVASRYRANYSGWQRVPDARCLTSPAHLLCAALQLG